MARLLLLMFVIGAMVSAPARALDGVGASEGAVAERSDRVSIVLEPSHAPAVGEAAELRISALSSVEVGSARVRLSLPAALTIESLPSEWRRLPGKGPLGGDLLESELRLGPGSEVSRSLPVVARDDGAVWVLASASPSSDERLLLADAGLPVTIGTREGGSFIGHVIPRVGSIYDERLAIEGGESGTIDTSAQRKKTEAPEPGHACISGRVRHREAGGLVASRRVRVEAFDYDQHDSADWLAESFTDDEGQFELCFENHDEEKSFHEDDTYPSPHGEDPFLVISAKGPNWAVASGLIGAPYSYAIPDQSQPFCDCGDAIPGTPLFSDMADVAVELDPELVRPAKSSGIDAAFQISNTIRRGWAWVRSDGSGGSWGLAGDGSVRALWAPDSTDEFEYTPATNAFWVPKDGFHKTDSILHELGHFLMDLLGQGVAFDPSCLSHVWDEPSSITCAWSEGGASWLAASIQGKDDYKGYPLEQVDWFTYGSKNSWHEWVEANVASFLFDADDSKDTGPWDRLALDPVADGEPPKAGTLWKRFASHPSVSLFEFVHFWLEDIGDDAQARSDLLATLFANRVEFEVYHPFHDDLQSRTPLRRQDPVHPHEFRTTAMTKARWSVIGLRSDNVGLSLEVGSEHPLGGVDYWGQSADPKSPDEWVAFRATAGRPSEVLARVNRTVNPNGAESPLSRWQDYVIELDDGQFFGIGKTPFQMVDDGPASSFVRSVTVSNLDPWKPLGVAIESADAGNPVADLFMIPLGTYGFANRVDMIPSAPAALSFVGPSRRTIALSAAADSSIGLVIVRDGDQPMNGDLYVDQTPPDLVTDPPTAHVAATFVPYARLSLGFDPDPETDVYAARVSVDRTNIAASPWVPRDGGTGPVSWTDTCTTMMPGGSTLDVPCQRPTLNVSGLVAPFVIQGAQTIQLHVQVMNRAGMTSDVVDLDVPVKFP